MYAPIVFVPRDVRENSPVIYDYPTHLVANSILTGHVKIRVDVNAALALADASPYPRGVRLGVMKQVANAKEITLEQMRILLGWAAHRSQRAGMR